MKKVFESNNFHEILNEIISHNYDMNYASVIASDYFFEENPNVEFTEDFADNFNLVMNYLLDAHLNDTHSNFKRIINDLKEYLDSNDIEKEDIIYILEKKSIQKYEDLYKQNKITYDVFKRQIMKLGDFNFEKLIEKYIDM